VEAAELDGALTAADVIDLNTGEVIVEANVELTADRLHKVLSSGARASRSSSPSATTWATSLPTR
jgi:hypothetical protein